MGTCTSKEDPPKYVAPPRRLTSDGTNVLLDRLELLAPHVIAMHRHLTLFPCDMCLANIDGAASRLKGIARTLLDSGWYKETQGCLVILDRLLGTVDSAHRMGDLVVGALNLGPFIL